ncbi:type VII secretion protein EccB [Amycolatopsis sp. NPDC059657]|uniref:type VII secretion protein EccB n=1 Tax=Amycolatopsis sp. NPDC059657 TaxID=3346899 RepID=UPI00366C669B
MQSRRDQVQAYFFVVGRLVAGLVQGKPDVLEHPNKRFNGGTVLGVLLAGLLMAIFGIYGLFVPGGNNSWRVDGTIVLDEGSGARYVYVGGQLRPVLNMASALLAVGQNSKLASVSQSSLTGVPVGTPIGIPGAPDGMPSAGKLNAGNWTVCARPADGLTVSSAATVTLRLDQPGGVAIPAEQGLVVSTPDGAAYLVWRGNRHRIADMVTQEALGYDTGRAVRVSPAWLNVIPAGADLKPPSIPGIGGVGPAVGGQPGRVGQVYEVRNPAITSDQFYVLTGSGLLPISHTVGAMLLAAPSTRDAYPGDQVRPILVGPGALAGVAMVGGEAHATDLPPTPPAIADLGVGMEPCMSFDLQADGGHVGTLVALARASENQAVAPAGKQVAGATADQIVVPAGGGALVSSWPVPGAAPGTEYLVTDLGVKYPLADDSVAASLGYGSVSGKRISPVLLNLLPTGPALDPAAALTSRLVGS